MRPRFARMGDFEDGLTLREKRLLKQAVAAFERAVESEPTHVQAWFWLAVTRDNRGQEADAIPAYERAISLGLDGEDLTRALAWLASSYSKTARHHEAVTAITRAADLGGYMPTEEFDALRRQVLRRSGRRT